MRVASRPQVSGSLGSQHLGRWVLLGLSVSSCSRHPWPPRGTPNSHLKYQALLGWVQIPAGLSSWPHRADPNSASTPRSSQTHPKFQVARATAHTLLQTALPSPEPPLTAAPTQRQSAVHGPAGDTVTGSQHISVSPTRPPRAHSLWPPPTPTPGQVLPGAGDEAQPCPPGADGLGGKQGHEATDNVLPPPGSERGALGAEGREANAALLGGAGFTHSDWRAGRTLHDRRKNILHCGESRSQGQEWGRRSTVSWFG